MTNFPNRAGQLPDNDEVLTQELHDAGIMTLDDKEHLSTAVKDVFKKSSGEVVTSVIGELHGWTFRRAWRYWVATGPGIDVLSAEALHREWGHVVRVDGDATCPSPRDRYKGFGCSLYHIDTPEGLAALARTLNMIVYKSTNLHTGNQRYVV